MFDWASYLFNLILVLIPFSSPPSDSEFEELEAFPSMSLIEGPLEPSPTVSTATEAPEDPTFVNFFSVCAVPLIQWVSHFRKMKLFFLYATNFHIHSSMKDCGPDGLNL